MNSHLLRLFFFVVPTVSVFSSNALVPLVAIVAVLTVGISYFETKTLPKFSRKQLAIFIAFFGWVSISTLWALFPLTSFKLDLRLMGLTIAGLLLLHAVSSQDDESKQRFAKALLIGVILASVLLLIEVFFDAPIIKTIKGKPLDVGMNLSRFNRGATFIGVTIWMLLAIFFGQMKLFIKLLFPFIPLGVMYFAPSESTLLAVFLALVWYFVFIAVPKIGFKALPILMIFSVLVMPFATQKLEPLYDAESSQSIPFSAKHRFFIWEFVSGQVLDNPIRGWGFDVARDYPNKDGGAYVHVTAEGKERIIDGRIISLHPHNFALQVWLELGLVGALLVSVIIWMVFGYLRSMNLADNIAIQSMMVTTFIIALLGYGIWQNRWFVMFFIFASMIPLIRTGLQKNGDEHGV